MCSHSLIDIRSLGVYMSNTVVHGSAKTLSSFLLITHRATHSLGLPKNPLHLFGYWVCSIVAQQNVYLVAAFGVPLKKNGTQTEVAKGF